MYKVDRILSKVWLRYKFNFSLRMILEPDVPRSKQKYDMYSERRIVLQNPVSYKKSASGILRWYGYVVISPHITIRSFQGKVYLSSSVRYMDDFSRKVLCLL